MDHVHRGYENSTELDHYQGMDINNYNGMEVHSYPGGLSDEGSEKHAFNSRVNVYEEDPRNRLHRNLKTRQISMIALGGALGTGLLINTGPGLAQAGPGSMLIGYTLVGVLCYAVMAAMGEMATWLPLPSGFTGFAHRFVDPAFGFALGWNYWLKYIVTTPNNIIAGTLVIKYWFNDHGYDGPGSNTAIYVTLFLVVIVSINYFGVAFFGELEFWLSSLKILILIALVMFTLVIAAGGGPNHEPTGFKYWSNPGAFATYKLENGPGRFLAFWSVLKAAVFSYLGAELVGVTIGEAQNPRKAIPRAVKLTFFRIVFFYLILILFLGMTVPHNSHDLLSANNEASNRVSAEASPFVVAARLASVNTLPNIINVCLLIFTFSAANSDLYIATRTLYALSVEGNAPAIFSRTSSRGVPVYALALSSSISLIAFISVKTGAFVTFQYFINLVTIFGILTWISILVSHICFVRARMAQNVPDSALVYVSPFGRNGSIAALIFASIITIFNGWATFVHDPTTGKFDWKNFIVDYIGIPIYLAMIFGYKFVMKSERVKPEDADLFGGKAKIDDEEAEFLAEEQRKRGGRGEKGYEKLYRVTLGVFF